jgi:hypothetical protein
VSSDFLEEFRSLDPVTRVQICIFLEVASRIIHELARTETFKRALAEAQATVEQGYGKTLNGC